MRQHNPSRSFWLSLFLLGGGILPAEVILQYFQMPWRSLTQKMPELAEAGYTALWLPPPTKASGGLSVGYDLWDPFDLGSKDQRGGVRTFYGTQEELQEMVRTAHRFGIRVYFDNIMNHRAFDIPGFNETTPIGLYPGMRPEDFHLRVTEDGFYRKWDNTRNWNDEWQVLHLGLSDLIDIAHEAGIGGWNHNFGPTEGSHHPGISFVRHPDNPEYYDLDPGGAFVGFGNVTQAMLDNNPGAYTENVNAYLMRAVRWKMHMTKADGLRLDAVKHVPAVFFGALPDENQFLGYTGNIQLAFQRARGFVTGNPRESLFDINKPRNSAMIFGEHLGTPPAFEPYIQRGMRLKDAPLRDKLNGILGSPWGNLAGMDAAGYSGNPAFNQNTGVAFPHSHDSDYASARELQYAYIMSREGLPIVYTDGYFKAGTLQDSGGAFPRHANTNFLGQFADGRLPNLAYIREHFARGGQLPHWSDSDVVAFSRTDKREAGWGSKAISDGDGFTMLFMMNDNYSAGQARSIGGLPIAATPGGPDTWLVNYSTYGGPFGVWASAIATGNVTIPPGGYFIFSFRTPEGSSLWNGNELTIYQDGEEPGTVRVTRRDGPNGDAQFNPYGLANRGFPDGETPEPFRYQMTVPRITSPNLRFVARVNGLAQNVHMKLNGGIDLNSQMGISGNPDDVLGKRDFPPGASTDTFLGWEQARFVHRQHAEKFAAADSSRNQIGSAGAETYHWNGGTDFTIVEGPANANDGNAGGTRASFIFHNPTGDVGGNDTGYPGEDDKQFELGAESITLWAKTNSVGAGFRMYVYYTMDGTNPEGSGGEGLGSTRAVSMGYSHDEAGDDWWGTAILPLPGAGEQLRYKIGIFRDAVDGLPVSAGFPTDQGAINFANNMMTVFEVADFNAATIDYYPHNDWAEGGVETGLQEGMNFIQARAYLNRGNGAPLYNTFKQTFYLDLERPAGEIVFPAQNDTLPSQEYGAVVRTDSTVTEVWFRILDSDGNNDDAETGIDNGNNAWVRASEVQASPQIGSAFPREWRFTYRNIPSSGTATLQVRLVELSSSPDFALSDELGHFTTLERQVNTSAPEQKLFVAWPQNDGDTVGVGYDMKAHFSKSLAAGVSEENLIDRFTVRINSRAIGKNEYRILWDETGSYHALALLLPQLYNGDPDYLHQIEVVHAVPAGVTLQAFRQVRAVPVGLPASLAIVDPEQFDSNGRQTVIVLPDVASPTLEERQYEILVSSDKVIDAVTLTFEDLLGGSVAPVNVLPEQTDTQHLWRFTWTITQPGTYVFRARGFTGGNEVAEDFRSIPVIFRQIVAADSSGDADNDGLPDDWEITQRPLPETDSEDWNNGDVHVWIMSGRTNPLMPVTDGGGLPDGLQVGLVGPILPDDTNLLADTNGDGFPNFIPDLDPPIFNTLDNTGNIFNRSRTDQIAGSMTNPSQPDSDFDGLRDAEEDLNRNGRVDIGFLDGNGKVTAIMVHPDILTVYNSSRVDREALPVNAVFLETDPNSADTIGDGLPDGQSDLARNGRVNMYLLHENDSLEALEYTDWTNTAHFAFNRMPNNLAVIYWDDNNLPAHIPNADGYDFAPIRSRAVHYEALFAAYNREGTGSAQTGGWPKLLITETDPLVMDTIGDGLPDGWKVRYGLDPLDDGVYNWRTGEPGDPRNGPAGDITGDGITNAMHFFAGTDPRIAVAGVAPPEDSITVGPGAEIGQVNGVPRLEEFKDWTWNDLRALDAFEGGGNNHQGGDIFPAYDGWDSSRDLTAFYSRDGGAASAGGDDRMYFRIDFHDLQAFAEQGNLDLYVAINFGNTENPIGERVLPDEVDTLTDMRWRAVVAVYESSSGTVYVDTDPLNNTNTFGQNLAANGVQSRPGAFIGAYYNSELDAMEFAIDRQALLDAGWLGLNPAELRYQVFATKSGTQNSPQGPGDIGGRSDIRDSIYNDSIAEDHWFAQQGLQGAGSVLRNWIPGNAWAGRVKVAMVIHGNQSIRRGQEMQNLINNNAGAGYFRPIDTHEVYGVPLNLHITPTLAGAIQWASSAHPLRDGPAFNARLGDLMREGVLQLMGTTFSDHILPYFDNDYNADNVALAHKVLSEIYNIDMSGLQVFYPPERVLDADVLQKISALGFNFTLVDQMMHIRQWFGREAALGQDGYRINQVHGVGAFALNDQAGEVKFEVHDRGAPMALRRQLNRMARSGTQDQVLIIHAAWEDFLDADNAAAYDALIRWMANRAWIEIVTLEDIAAGRVDTTRDGNGNTWWQIDRGSPALPKVAQEWIHYATRENYDNWYVGSAQRQGVQNTVFNIRPREPLPESYGMQALGSGIVGDAWAAVNGIQNEDLRLLASGVLHASTFITAFHDQPSVDLRKFSDGTYINPDWTYRELAAFTRHNQAQTRRAAIYARVDQWASNPPTSTQAVAQNIDLDGEDEYLLYNDRLFAVMERTGGRMIAAWLRHPVSGRVFQVVGNLMSYAGGDTEFVGASNADARRVGALTDWWAGTSDYVNDVYSFVAASNGWTATSSDGKISKTITLADDGDGFALSYTVDPTLNGGALFVRHGLSPDLFSLLIHGQNRLSAETHDSGVMTLRQGLANDFQIVSRVDYSDTAVAFQSLATDVPSGESFSTVNMRNQAQTHQVELQGQGSFAFSMSFTMETGLLFDSDDDGLPDVWEEQYFGGPTAVANPQALAANGVNTLMQAYIAGIDPTDADAAFVAPPPVPQSSGAQTGVWIRLPFAIQGRRYVVYYTDDLMAPDWRIAAEITPHEPPEDTEWLDQGDQTRPHPLDAGIRFYHIEVELE